MVSQQSSDVNLLLLDCEPGSYLALDGTCVLCPNGMFSSSGSTVPENCEYHIYMT